MYILVCKLKVVKQGLKGLHRTNYSNIPDRIDIVRQQLDTIQSHINSNPISAPLIQQQKEVQQELVDLLKADSSLIAQRAKLKWL